MRNVFLIVVFSSLCLHLSSQVIHTDSLCAVFDEYGSDFLDDEVDMTDSSNVYWKTVKIVLHVHYSVYDSWAEIPLDHVYNSIDNLNEQFEDYMFSFDLVQVRYHDMVDGTTEGYNLATGVTCAPYNQSSLAVYAGDKVWDMDEFMNVHLLPDMCGGILGFAFRYPAFYNWTDGVWVQTSVFGTDGDYLLNYRDENKTLVHEVGHYLGLHHPFNGTDVCNEGVSQDCSQVQDRVCDTPPMPINWSCEAPVCSDESFWEGQPWEGYVHNNHMDYYIDSCRTAFTYGQFLYMHNHMHYYRYGIIDGIDPTCVGDINGDYVVGSNDLLSVLSCWGSEATGVCSVCDINSDGFVNLSDLQIVLSVYETQCAGPVFN